LAGHASPAETRSTVRHLLTGCAECRRATAQTSVEPRPAAVSAAQDPDADYSRTFEMARRVTEQRQRELRSEREAASHLVAALAAQPREEWEASVESDPRFRSWSLVGLLLSGCHELGFRNPAKAVELAELAVAVSRQLSDDRYGRARIEDLQARAYSELGNALRIESDFRAAEKAFANAKAHLDAGTGDSLERARVLLLEASLYGNMGRFDRAFALLDHVVRIARRFEDRHLHGKALITKAFFSSYAEQADASVQLLYEGIDLIDATQEPRLVLVAWHNLILNLSYQGKFDEALEKLPYIRSLHEKFGNHLDLLRLRWVEARLSVDLGEMGRAEETFEDVRCELIEAGIGYDAALVSLDLANLYLRCGETEKMGRLAQEMLPIFKSRDVHREAIAALIVFQKAAEMEKVTLSLVEDLGQYLRRARNNPNLRFRPSSSSPPSSPSTSASSPPPS
jgi:tetratricopeptide (TPR) repeat protein